MSEPAGSDHPESPDHHVDHETERIAERAHLLPEELAAGSDDPDAQAEAILEDSDARTDGADA